MKKLIKHLPGLLLALALVLFFASGNGMEVSADPVGTAWSGGQITQSGTYYLDISGDTLQLTEQIQIGSNLNVTIDLNGKTVKGAAATRCFYVLGELTIKNGTIAGSETAVTADSGNGGNIYVNAGTFTLENGGLVTGGKATNRGGNIYVTGGGMIKIAGGSVTNGVAVNGGNIYTMYATVEMTSGLILNGAASSYGDNIYTSGSSGKSSTLKISGGEVDAGNSTTNAYSMLISGGKAYGTNLEISGGILRGKIYLEYVKSSILSGKPVIEHLYFGNGNLITPGALTNGASITVQTATAGGAITETIANAESVAQYFHPYINGESVVAANGVLKVGTYCNHCDTMVSWTTITATTSFSDSGHYKLASAVTLSESKTIPAGATVTIDLGGNTLTAATETRCFYVVGTLDIFDSGTGGTITGGDVSSASGTNESRGGNVFVGSKGVLRIYGGTITSGKATRGGNISGEGQVYLHGGAVTNGNATDGNGHNIYVQERTGILNITGGTVGAVTGEKNSIYSLYATIDISGGAIEGAVCAYGYNSKGGVEKYSTLYISGGTFNGNVTAMKAEEAAYAEDTEPVVVISGGTLNGITSISAAKDFSLSGAPVINRLNLGAGVLVSPSQLSANAEITVLDATGVFTVPLTNAEAYKNWFAATNTTKTVAVYENCLVMKNSGGTNGTSGNISWALSGDGVLTISGNGSMNNYGWLSSRAPWYSSRSSIKTVVIQSGVTSIGNYAFYNCSNLKSVDIAGTVTAISSSAFNGSSALDSVQFRGTKNQWTDTLASGVGDAKVKIYGSVGFTSNISYQVSGGTLTITGTGAMPNYYYDSELTSLLGTPWKDRAAEITSVVISDGITAIGSWAFYDLENLTSVTIPSSVTTIGNNAFRGCGSLTEIIIPNSVETVRQGAFTQTGLETVVYEGTVAQWEAITVENFNEPLVNADINCDGLKVESVTIKTNPTDTVYIAGQALDPTGLVVTVTYAGGTTADITEGYQLTYDFSTAGTKTVTVTYGGKTATFQVVVGILGDVDGNGSVTKNDAVYVLWYLEGKADLPYEEFADFDGNGVVTKNDAVYILWYVSGKIAP